LFIDNIIELSFTNSENLPPQAVTLAHYSLLDWLVCGRAGIDEPLAHNIRKFALKEAGTEMASIFGGGKVPARMAALVNGTISHALDYDDTHFGHIGHLSVGVYPAAIAVAQELGKPISEAIDAFVIGAEAAIRIGMILGSQHYNHGFHQTATAGAFGATIAAGRLYGLNETQMRYAIGLCSTRASGLKSQFGTMGKPYNAGISASNGVECAQLARLGFTSSDDGLMGLQGFVQTHSFDVNEEDAWKTPPSEKFLFEDNKYKLHACCHGLHAMIEALSDTQLHKVSLEDVKAIDIKTNPRWLRVCNIEKPRTGLEVKFSYAWLAGMTLRGDATGDDSLYVDGLVSDEQLKDVAQKVRVTGVESLTDTQAVCKLTISNGQIIEVTHDLAEFVPVDILKEKLERKAVAVLENDGARVWELLSSLNQMKADEIGQLMSKIA